MIRVTRYDAAGNLFQTCVTSPPITLETDYNGVTSISMPARYWLMRDGGRIEIEALLTRDPRTDPKSGDVVSTMVYRREVKRVEYGRVYYHFASLPHLYCVTLDDWLAVNRNAKVIHAAD